MLCNGFSDIAIGVDIVSVYCLDKKFQEQHILIPNYFSLIISVCMGFSSKHVDTLTFSNVANFNQNSSKDQ